MSEADFILAIAMGLGVSAMHAFRDENAWAWFKSNPGKGALAGIAKALAVAGAFMLVASLLGCSGHWGNGASGYVGLERTKSLSPQCEDTGPDSHITSNLGMRYHAYESKDGKFKGNGKYTHHSCAFSPDDKSYDAVGMELEYKLW